MGDVTARLRRIIRYRARVIRNIAARAASGRRRPRGARVECTEALRFGLGLVDPSAQQSRGRRNSCRKDPRRGDRSTYLTRGASFAISPRRGDRVRSQWKAPPRNFHRRNNRRMKWRHDQRRRRPYSMIGRSSRAEIIRAGATSRKDASTSSRTSSQSTAATVKSRPSQPATPT